MYWKGVAASMESLFKTISSCLTYLDGDEAIFSSVYACFAVIKFHLSTLDAAFVKDSLNLINADIEHMIQLTHHRFMTIYTEAHHDGLAFAINQQTKFALACLTNGNENICRQIYTSEFANFIT